MRAKRCAARLKAIKYHLDNHNRACLRSNLRTSTSPNILSTFSSKISVLYVTWKDFKPINSHNSSLSLSCDHLQRSGLSAKALTHINVEDQMTVDLLISWRYTGLWFLPGIKFRENVIHILAHWIPPQFITILTVKMNCLGPLSYTFESSTNTWIPLSQIMWFLLFK